jgi:hypothetical protein
MESRPNQPCNLGGRAAAGGATQFDVCSVQMFIRVFIRAVGDFPNSLQFCGLYRVS